MSGGVAKAIGYATAQLGKPYLWGGESETNGFDCSGLTQTAYGIAGLGLPRTAAAQYAATSPNTVAPSGNLQVGDLLFFGADPAHIHHVAIYAGNGLVLNAPHTGAKVRFDKLTSFPDFYAATRPLDDGSTVPAATQSKGGVVHWLFGAGSNVVSVITDPVGSVKHGIGDVTSAGQQAIDNVTTAATTAALSGVQRYLVEGVLLAGGVALVGVGIYRGVKS